ncbi:P-loop containing nucleoside triphosphate hydrolase protein [Russula earlei]|uniref:P-loop containing nucleoside triphosphate hydrolase protein n=1 Tax=Russula earlei TaxID=71964 RepID=A0ACC0ULV6_9AGAM|nr:P-loop containing nucleoside triphosphate hydrolase protein [Russula earlei]
MKTCHYNYTTTRQSIENKFRAVFGGKPPYSWQVDVTEALLLGLDCVVIAGTGSGKTMPFGMPLLLDEAKDNMVVVISPLNELEAEQAERFHKLGLTATAVNGDVYNEQLHKDIKERKHRVLLTSPEMCLEHPTFSKLMRTPEFTRNIFAFVVDEAHCISQWGDLFRKKYAELGRLRSFVPDSVPILATSATMPPHILNDVRLKLCLSESQTFTVNLGNDRPNITPIICRMRGAANDLDALNFAINEANAPGAKLLIRTIIYFNTRDLAYKGHMHLRGLIPEEMRSRVDFLHAGQTRRAKRKVMNDFWDGKVDILCATEIAGMGMDIQDVPRVIQFMVPPTLSVWTQRLGCAGRSGEPAIVILLVEPSDPDDKDKDEENNEDAESDTVPADPTYQKKVEEAMRKWIEATECRRDVSDAYFDNPLHTTDLIVPCCDLCVLKKVANGHVELTPAEANLMMLYDHIRSREVLAAPATNGLAQQAEESGDDGHATGATDLQATKRARHPGARRKERLEACRNALMNWRQKTWQAGYKDCIWGPNVLLPDPILTKIATRTQIRTLCDIKEGIPEWIWADEYGEAVLKLLEPIDRSWCKENEQKKAENKAKRSKVSAERKSIRDEERLAKARASTAQRRVASSSHPALRQVYPALSPSRQTAPQPTTYSIQYYPHPVQYAAAYPVPGYPPLSFNPYHPPSS